MTRKQILIFGNSQIAELAKYYFKNDGDRRVVAFTVDGQFVKEDSFCGIPVIPFEDVENVYPPDVYDAFVALSYTKLNTLRALKYQEMKGKGYKLVSYISSKSTIWPGITVGDNCFILEDNTIQPFTRIGNNVTLWSGNHIGHHSSIEDHVFIASHVVISGDVNIGRYSFLGVNATIRDGITIGERCILGAGSLLLENAAPEGVYVGVKTERSKVPSSRIKNI